MRSLHRLSLVAALLCVAVPLSAAPPDADAVEAPIALAAPADAPELVTLTAFVLPDLAVVALRVEQPADHPEGSRTDSVALALERADGVTAARTRGASHDQTASARSSRQLRSLHAASAAGSTNRRTLHGRAARSCSG